MISKRQTTKETILIVKWEQYDHSTEGIKWFNQKRIYTIVPTYNFCPIQEKNLRVNELTALFKASVAVFLSAGSIARRVSIKDKAEDGKSLKVSLIHLLYGSRGLNIVAFGSFDFFQYSSEGEPHNLYILCNCSTYKNEDDYLICLRVTVETSHSYNSWRRKRNDMRINDINETNTLKVAFFL